MTTHQHTPRGPARLAPPLIAASVLANLMIAAALIGVFAPGVLPLLADGRVIWPLLVGGILIETVVMIGILRALRRLRTPPGG
ncbi:MAG: hypothetical protein AB7O21_05620 [Gammaproteobacteria bacterium]